uniref:Uncharacterized protein n=1 Tax=Sorghum bicolor TaxID=4558 RepID=C6JRT1_SORBI
MALSRALIVFSVSPPLLRRAQEVVSRHLRPSDYTQCFANIPASLSSRWLQLPSFGCQRQKGGGKGKSAPGLACWASLAREGNWAELLLPRWAGPELTEVTRTGRSWPSRIPTEQPSWARHVWRLKDSCPAALDTCKGLAAALSPWIPPSVAEGKDNKGGVSEMEAFLKKFFPGLLKSTARGGDKDVYCIYNNQALTAFTLSLYAFGMVGTLLASRVTRRLGRQAVMLIGGNLFLTRDPLPARAATRVQVTGGDAIGGRGDDGIAQGVVVRLKGMEEEGRHRAPLGREALLGMPAARNWRQWPQGMWETATARSADSPRGGGVGHEELLRVDGVAQRDAVELDANADVDAAAGAQPHGAHAKNRDRDACEGKGTHTSPATPPATRDLQITEGDRGSLVLEAVMREGDRGLVSAHGEDRGLLKTPEATRPKRRRNGARDRAPALSYWVPAHLLWPITLNVADYAPPT